MILIWNGAGIVVAVIWFGSLFAGRWLAGALFGADVSTGLSNLTCEWLAAALTLVFALLLRAFSDPQPDPNTGLPASGLGDHSLFFIPVIVWPVIFFVLGIGLYYGDRPNSGPAIVTVTPAAAKEANRIAAAARLPKGWYVQIEAWMLKDENSPAYKIAVVTGPVGEYYQSFEARGVKVVVLRRQVEMLKGAQLDFGKGEDGDEKEFFVTNPSFEGEGLEKWRRDLERERPPNQR